MEVGVQSPLPVADDEPLTRFLVYSDWFGTSPWRVKHQAFLPHPYVELSVSRIQGLDETTVWQAGQAVAEQRQRTLHGRGDVENTVILQTGLHTAPSEPPPRHANILGWPPDKAAQKIKALQISGHATLVLKPA